MIVDKYKMDDGLYQIILDQDNKKLVITFGRNLDLYWSLIEENRKNDFSEILITKENYRIYSLFDELYERIKNCDVYTSYKDLNNDLKERRQHWKRDPFKNNMIEWHCDDAPYDESHVLKIIKKDEDSYLVRFEFSKKETFNLLNRYSVRISNSGSNHNPYNIVFMDMFYKLQNYDLEDTQIYIEEYIYQKKLEIKK